MRKQRWCTRTPDGFKSHVKEDAVAKLSKYVYVPVAKGEWKPVQYNSNNNINN